MTIIDVTRKVLELSITKLEVAKNYVIIEHGGRMFRVLLNEATNTVDVMERQTDEKLIKSKTAWAIELILNG